jgi:hypothetical protein
MQASLSPKQLLEQFIDGSSLFAVLELIEVICEEKADHIASNWQDERLARAWQHAAYRVNLAANSKTVLAVS